MNFFVLVAFPQLDFGQHVIIESAAGVPAGPPEELATTTERNCNQCARCMTRSTEKNTKNEKDIVKSAVILKVTLNGNSILHTSSI